MMMAITFVKSAFMSMHPKRSPSFPGRTDSFQPRVPSPYKYPIKEDQSFNPLFFLAAQQAFRDYIGNMSHATAQHFPFAIPPAMSPFGPNLLEAAYHDLYLKAMFPMQHQTERISTTETNTISLAPSICLDCTSTNLSFGPLNLKLNIKDFSDEEINQVLMCGTESHVQQQPSRPKPVLDQAAFLDSSVPVLLSEQARKRQASEEKKSKSSSLSYIEPPPPPSPKISPHLRHFHPNPSPSPFLIPMGSPALSAPDPRVLMELAAQATNATLQLGTRTEVSMAKQQEPFAKGAQGGKPTPEKKPEEPKHSSSDVTGPDSHDFMEKEEPWTAEEHRQFMQGLRKYGREWAKIEGMLPSKTASQIRAHAYDYFSKIIQQSATCPSYLPRGDLQDQKLLEVAEVISTLSQSPTNGMAVGRGFYKERKEAGFEAKEMKQAEERDPLVEKRYLENEESHILLDPSPKRIRIAIDASVQEKQ